MHVPFWLSLSFHTLLNFLALVTAFERYLFFDLLSLLLAVGTRATFDTDAVISSPIPFAHVVLHSFSHPLEYDTTRTLC